MFHTYGFAASDEVGARATDGVLDDVGDEEGEEDADGEAEHVHVCLVRFEKGKTGYYDDGGWDQAGIDE